jgi:hypothetical protein
MFDISAEALVQFVFVCPAQEIVDNAESHWQYSNAGRLGGPFST